MKSSFGKLSVLCAVLFGWISAAYGYTSADYYKAGLQLYNAQNYAQAIQYFNAAIRMDPNNAAALQARANSYYAQGRYPEALSDYQQVQALEPGNTQLASFIQALQAKVGGEAAPAPSAGGPSEPAASGGPGAGNSFAQGVALYQQQQYSAAVPYFQKATQENPRDSMAYYYLGVSQMQAGDMKDAAVALGISDKLKANPSVEAYVNQLKSRLSPDDQQWVDGQISAGPQGGSRSTAASKPKSFGIRLEPAVLMLNLADFQTNAQSWENEAKVLQSNDPSISYNGSVPAGAPDIGIEPVLRLGPQFEIGLLLAPIPVGTASDGMRGNSGLTATDSYNITAFSVGFNARYLFGAGDFQPFVSAGAMVVPINIGYSASGQYGGLSYTSSGNFGGVAAGGQASLGLDWRLGDTFAVSPFAGFQFASGNSFQATVNSAQGGNSTGQTAQLEVVPTSAGGVIAPVADGKLMQPVSNGNSSYAAGSDAPPGSRPLAIDLGGPTFGVQVSAYF